MGIDRGPDSARLDVDDIHQHRSQRRFAARRRLPGKHEIGDYCNRQRKNAKRRKELQGKPPVRARPAGLLRGRVAFIATTILVAVVLTVVLTTIVTIIVTIVFRAGIHLLSPGRWRSRFHGTTSGRRFSRTLVWTFLHTSSGRKSRLASTTPIRSTVCRQQIDRLSHS